MTQEKTDYINEITRKFAEKWYICGRKRSI